MNKIFRKIIALLTILSLAFSGVLVVNASWQVPYSLDFIDDQDRVVKEIFQPLTIEVKKNASKILGIPEETFLKFTEDVAFQPIQTPSVEESMWYVPEFNTIFLMIHEFFEIKKNKDYNDFQRELTYAFICNYIGLDAMRDNLGFFFIEGIADLFDENIIPTDDLLDLDDYKNVIYSLIQFKPDFTYELFEEKKSALYNYFKYAIQKWLAKGEITLLEFLDRVKNGEKSIDVFLETGGREILKENVLMSGTLLLYEEGRLETLGV